MVRLSGPCLNHSYIASFESCCGFAKLQKLSRCTLEVSVCTEIITTVNNTFHSMYCGKPSSHLKQTNHACFIV